jgi:hypothetical protein
MAAKRIVIVDDSSFSIAFIRGILEENGFEVVGEAGTLDEVKKKTSSERRGRRGDDGHDAAGTDGLECTRAIHEIRLQHKGYRDHSMMDDEIVKRRRRTGCPPLTKTCRSDACSRPSNASRRRKTFDYLQGALYAGFRKPDGTALNRLTKTLLTCRDVYAS